MMMMTVQVMHGSNAPLLGRIIHENMDKLKSGDPVTETIALEDAVPGTGELPDNLIQHDHGRERAPPGPRLGEAGETGQGNDEEDGEQETVR